MLEKIITRDNHSLLQSNLGKCNDTNGNFSLPSMAA